MSEKPKEYEDEEGPSVDPPNNTDPEEYRSSPSDNEPIPVDPPNNT